MELTHFSQYRILNIFECLDSSHKAQTPNRRVLVAHAIKHPLLDSASHWLEFDHINYQISEPWEETVKQ